MISHAFCPYSDEGRSYQDAAGHVNGYENETWVKQSWITDHKVDPLHTFTTNGEPLLDEGNGPYLPRWETSPLLETNFVNQDMFLAPGIGEYAKKCLETESVVIGGFEYAPPGDASYPNPTTRMFAILRSMWEGTEWSYLGDPMTHLYMPVYDSFNVTVRKPVAIVNSLVHWRAFFRDILPPNVVGITIVLENACDGFHTYRIDGPEANVIGFGDHHEVAFSDMERTATFTTDRIADGTETGIKFNQGSCPYTLHVYPSQIYYQSHMTKDPIVITFSVAMVFLFTIFMFLIYDWLVERRQKLVLAKATQSTAIVSSLFPKNVRDRLLQTDTDNKANPKT